MQTAKVPLPPKLIPVFQGKARYRGAYGGRGSAKTRSFATMMAVDGYRLGKSGISGLLLCAREHLVNLSESSMEEVKESIRSVPWLDAYYDIGETYIRSNDRRISFAFTGLRHNLDGVKSKARILRAWVDEAEQVSEAGWRKLIPTVRAEDDSADAWWQSEIWITWNSELVDSATNQRFRENQPVNSKIVMLNYSDNPWFPDVLEQERLEDLRLRPETYEHVWKGDYLTITDAQVFKDKFTVEPFEVDPEWDGPYHGLDFGFADDATAATRSYIHGNSLYISHDYTRKKLELDETAPALATAIPQFSMYVIRADNARPESISYLSRHGLPRIIACKKGKGSVEDGVAYLKSFDHIYIHPRCTATASEFHKYSYKVDRLSGDILPVLVDAHNHCIDSLRYALEPLIRTRAKPRIRAL